MTQQSTKLEFAPKRVCGQGILTKLLGHGNKSKNGPLSNSLDSLDAPAPKLPGNGGGGYLYENINLQSMDTDSCTTDDVSSSQSSEVDNSVDEVQQRIQVPFTNVVQFDHTQLQKGPKSTTRKPGHTRRPVQHWSASLPPVSEESSVMSSSMDTSSATSRIEDYAATEEIDREKDIQRSRALRNESSSSNPRASAVSIRQNNYVADHPHPYPMDAFEHHQEALFIRDEHEPLSLETKNDLSRETQNESGLSFSSPSRKINLTVDTVTSPNNDIRNPEDSPSVSELRKRLAQITEQVQHQQDKGRQLQMNRIEQQRKYGSMGFHQMQKPSLDQESKEAHDDKHSPPKLPESPNLAKYWKEKEMENIQSEPETAPRSSAAALANRQEHPSSQQELATVHQRSAVTTPRSASHHGHVQDHLYSGHVSSTDGGQRPSQEEPSSQQELASVDQRSTTNAARSASRHRRVQDHSYEEYASSADRGQPPSQEERHGVDQGSMIEQSVPLNNRVQDHLHAGNNIQDLVVQQQKSLQMISRENYEFRKQLSDTQETFHKLRTEKRLQQNEIDRLHQEKESFQHQTLMLMEEMKQIRKELQQLKEGGTHASQQVMYNRRPTNQGYVEKGMEAHQNYKDAVEASNTGRINEATDPYYDVHTRLNYEQEGGKKGNRSIISVSPSTITNSVGLEDEQAERKDYGPQWKIHQDSRYVLDEDADSDFGEKMILSAKQRLKSTDGSSKDSTVVIEPPSKRYSDLALLLRVRDDEEHSQQSSRTSDAKASDGSTDKTNPSTEEATDSRSTIQNVLRRAEILSRVDSSDPMKMETEGPSTHTSVTEENRDDISENREVIALIEKVSELNETRESPGKPKLEARSRSPVRRILESHTRGNTSRVSRGIRVVDSDMSKAFSVRFQNKESEERAYTENETVHVVLNKDTNTGVATKEEDESENMPQFLMEDSPSKTSGASSSQDDIVSPYKSRLEAVQRRIHNRKKNTPTIQRVTI